MSLINRALNMFANWALARSPSEAAGVAENGPDEKPKPLVWAYTITDYLDGSPYLTRVLFPRVFGLRPMLHRFHRPDGDRAHHNHPWRWAFSIILRGGYSEERRVDDESELYGKAETAIRRVRRFNFLSGSDFHRVTELHGPETWTLFVTGPRVQGWGFLERLLESNEDVFTPWRKYIDRKRMETHRLINNACLLCGATAHEVRATKRVCPKRTE